MKEVVGELKRYGLKAFIPVSDQSTVLVDVNPRGYYVVIRRSVYDSTARCRTYSVLYERRAVTVTGVENLYGAIYRLCAMKRIGVAG